MNISKCIEHIYPGIVRFLDYDVKDDGKGIYVDWKTELFTEPTQAELDTAWIAVQAKETLDAIEARLELLAEASVLEKVKKDKLISKGKNQAYIDSATALETAIDSEIEAIETKLGPVEFANMQIRIQNRRKLKLGLTL